MNLILRLFTTSLGRKYIMAVTGLCLYGFVIVHMVGNLQIFLGRDTLNNYAALLKFNHEFLWLFRIGLGACVVLHVATAISLWRDNSAARPVPYAGGGPYKASAASQLMVVSGGIVLAFIVFHLMHFTVGNIFDYSATHHAWNGKHDVFAMVVEGFRVPWVSAFYIVGVGLLCFHLSHGIQSMFQSIGLVNTRYGQYWRLLGIASTIGIFLGMSAVPAAVLAGVIPWKAWSAPPTGPAMVSPNNP